MATDVRRHNFELDKSVSLRDIDIQSSQLKAEKTQGLRDIGQQREMGIEAAVNNALQRGIYHSGIREENVEQVNTLAGQAEGDLRGDISRALARLSNQRRGVAGRMFDDGSGAGGPEAAFNQLMDQINRFIRMMEWDPYDFAEGGGTPPAMAERRVGVPNVS